MNTADEFKRKFNISETPLSVYCPYRIAPVGAHSDYQHGLISGFAIDHGVEIVFLPSSNGEVKIYSGNFKGCACFSAYELPQRNYDWGDFAKAAFVSLKRKYRIDNGLFGYIYGSLPVGGLSSSAAVLISYICAICKINDISLTKSELIDFALYAEHDYLEMNVGKMDQSCEVYSKKNHLLFLDTLDDSYKLIPTNPDMPDYEFAVVFSGRERKLANTAFNSRVDEAKAASFALRAFAGIPYGSFKDSYMRDVPKEVFDEYKDKIPPAWRRRAEHFYGEFSRVQRGAKAWEQGNIEEFGKIMFESGYSSIYNWETGSKELQTLYEIMLKCSGIYGGRFSGAGFNGSSIALVNPQKKEEISAFLREEYLKVYPQYKDDFSVHFCKTADGVRF
ncbi:MAG: GHMP kinase [Clostridiales bacterium]|nr:GHMP kinase [Clostridiales bacterium]